MVAAKICLLLCAVGAQYYAMTPPNARPLPKERLKPTGWELPIAFWVHILAKHILCVCVLSEILVAYATRYESTAISEPIIAFLVQSDSCSLSLDRTVSSPALITGSCLSVIGSAIRIHCYSTLGKFFTFELSIRQDHKLITSGPYSIVRHPSYTSGLCVFLGVLLCHFHTQSWVVSCSGVFPSSSQAVKLTLACVWVAFISVVYSGLGSRIKKEEEMLEGNFGDQWRSYAKRVPYRLVPWLY
ncbi:uncharacterized protein EDB91DRAFT_1235023 [Suillus paluster]|uniref:uncharacterized protein n=1 Tax=Suillus paluster TaxID=48578 RepID=UPI001B87042B|nr:uncharacterized protein EDB91DRAFT_1235023 [Suillus paluster]KAG1750482.1 hypothetical protein EDB91DRAFT_1235023 [Suillus paluster]